MPNREQLERVKKINDLIVFIGDIDERLCSPYSSFFFSAKTTNGNLNNYSKFDFIGNKLFFFDKYTEERMYPYNTWGNPRGFSSGGTIWGLVNDFRQWIITGKSSNGKNGYGGLYCPHWGGKWTLELKDSVIDKAKDVGYLKEEDTSFTEYCKSLVERGSSWLVKPYEDEIRKIYNIAN